MSLNSRQRRQADERRAKEAVYRTHGEGPNPYPKEARTHRMWERWRRYYMDMELLIGEMEEAYGPMNATERYPQT